MKKFSWILVLVLALIFVVSCGNSKKEENKDQENTDTDEISDEEPTENDGDTEPIEADTDDTDTTDDNETPDEAVEPEKEPLKCEDFTEGLNENFIVGEGDNKLERSFILNLPENVESLEKLSVIFVYHGFGDSAANSAKFLGSNVNNETMPFILVVPEARDDVFSFGIPPKGLDWDMVNLEDGSAESDMFDSILVCLEKKWNIDEKHIHVSGFSAGAITANSVALERSEKIASVITYSGAYFSNPTTLEALGDFQGIPIGSFFSWPDFEENHNKYTQMFVFGEKEKDTWGYGGIFTIDFNKMAHLDAQYFSEMGHDAMLCNHGKNHTVTGISETGIIKFFADHPFGTEVSPYRENLPTDFSEICHFFTEDDIENDTENPDEGSEENDNTDENPDTNPDENPEGN